MSNNKYYYIIWDKKDNKPYLDCGSLPIFYSPNMCKGIVEEYQLEDIVVIKKINAKDLINLIT